MDQPVRILRVDLAHADDFSLGALRVSPSRCEVESAGERRGLEPRVMQVLVALAFPTWEVVTVEELIERCWNGLHVTNDAVHRCVRALRGLAASWGEPPFEIETIHRVGYFLKASVSRRVAMRSAPQLVWPPAVPQAVGGEGDTWFVPERRFVG